MRSQRKTNHRGPLRCARCLVKGRMIRLTRINRVPLVLNSDLIDHLEATPDTVIALTTGQKLVVMESAEEVIQKVIEFRRLIANRPESLAAHDE
jgi:flagellar protein FlbD